MSSAEAPVAAQTEPTAVAQEEPVVQQTEEAPVATEEAPAAPAESTIAIIEQGHLFKRGPAPLRLWQKRLFVLPAEGRPSYSLNNLRQVYRKNVKKSGAPKEEFVKANQYLLHTLATATVNASYILAYYKNDSSKDIPNGLINLGLATSVSAAPKIRPNAFVIKTKARDYVLSASTASETESWIKTLNEFVNADLPDYSDSEAYKQSYNDLASRQVFAKKTTPVNSSSVASEEEPFSASEAEFEPETTTTPTTEAPAAEAPAERSVTAEAAPAEAQTPSSPFAKSIYSNVVNFLTRKDKEAAPAPAAAAQPEEAAAEAAPEATQEAAADATADAAPEAEAPAAVEAPAAEEAIEEAPVATEDKVEAAEEPVEETADKAAEPAEEAPAAEAKPSRVKSFFSKEHNGLFKFFNKKTGETTVVKGPIENHEAHPDGELVPITQEEAQQVEAANSAAEAEVATEAVEEAPAAEVAEVAAEEPKVEEVKAKEVKTPLLQRIVSFTKGKSEPTSPAQATEKAVSAAASPVPEPVAEATTSESEPVAEEPAAASEEAPAAEAVVTEEPAADAERAVDAPAEEAAAPAEPHESSLQRAMSMILKGFHHEKKAEGEAPAAEAAATEEPAEVVAEPETSEAAVVTEEPVADADADAEVAAKEVDAEAADADAAATSPQRKPSMFARLGEYAYNAVSGTGAEAEVDESTPSPLADKIEAAIKHGALLKQGYVLRSLETRYFILGTDGVLRYYHSNRDAGEGKKIELNEGVQLKKAEPKFIDIVTKARGYRFAAKDAEERDEWIEVLSKFATLEVPAPVVEQAEAEAEETETPAQASDETFETADGPSEAVTAEASTDAVPPVVEEETKAVEPATEAPVAPEVKAQAA